jgi:hypothetical protein
MAWIASSPPVFESFRGDATASNPESKDCARDSGFALTRTPE